MLNKDQIQAWLLGYAWLGSQDEQAREVDCIMSQDGWQHLAVTAERFDSAQFGDGSEEMDGQSFALSALYECHDGPHLPTCPRT